jgi:hypothetical protein
MVKGEKKNTVRTIINPKKGVAKWRARPFED